MVLLRILIVIIGILKWCENDKINGINKLLMKYYLMGLKHFKNVAIACAPDNVGLAHELIGALRDSEVMPFDLSSVFRAL